MRNLLVLPFVLAACGAADTPLEEAFCTVLGGNATASITAADDASAAPEAAREDTRVDVTLLEDGDDYSGIVAYTPDEVGTFAFGFGEDIPVVLTDANGDEVPWQNEVTGATACTELAVRYSVALQMETYFLELGPTSSAMVSMVAEESDDDL